MLNLRTLKRFAARVLPEALKARMRGRLYGYRPSRVSLNVEVLGEADGVTTLSVDGIRLRLPTEAVTDITFHMTGNGESVEEMHAFLQVARTAGGRLWDVGAHRGFFSALFCLANPQNEAVAWEPAAPTAEAARALAALNGLEGRMTVRQMAVGDDHVTRTASVDSSGFIQIGHGEQTESVAFTTLDHEAEALGGGPRVLKVDVEGHELAVMRGGANVLRARPTLFLELHLDILEQRGESIAQLVDAVLGAGLAVETVAGRPLSRRDVIGLPYAVTRVVARPTAP